MGKCLEIIAIQQEENDSCQLTVSAHWSSFFRTWFSFLFEEEAVYLFRFNGVANLFVFEEDRLSVAAWQKEHIVIGFWKQ